jgi:glycine/D-amino acid oxidase-like deaminating enzyme
MSPGGMPVVGLMPGWENCYVANGGGIKGMLLCTGVGVAIAETISSGSTEIPIQKITH